MPTEYEYSVVCDIGGYDFVSYSQHIIEPLVVLFVVCDIGGYDFVSYSQHNYPTSPNVFSCL